MKAIISKKLEESVESDNNETVVDSVNNNI